MDPSKRLHKPSLDLNKKQTLNPNLRPSLGSSEPLSLAAPNPKPLTATILPIPLQTVHLSTETGQKCEVVGRVEFVEFYFLNQVLEKCLHEELGAEERGSAAGIGIELLVESIF
jgi:hypothetical protein